MGRERSYQELFERSPDALLIMEGDRFIECNPAAIRMLGYPDKQALLGTNTHPADISPPIQPCGTDSRAKAEQNLAVVFERGSHTFEWMHVDAAGDEFLVEVQLTLVRRGDQPLLHCSWRDISERKRLEGELHRAQRLEAVGRLAGGVAHDFNNLLVVIMSYADMLQEEIRAGRANAAHVEEIGKAAERAAQLTRQLLAFSRGQPAQVRPTDVRQSVQGLQSLLHRLIGEHVELLFDLDGERPLTVLIDPSQLEQIVVNLVTNARDAMPLGGRVEVSATHRRLGKLESVGPLGAGDYVVLRIRDHGSGMTEEQLDRAFDPFYTTKQLGKGTGLGLATVYGIAEQNGGHATIASVPDAGTTVEVLLPLTAESPVVADTPVAGPRPSGGGETILLVEDENSIRSLFADTLQKAGYRVVQAADGEQALQCSDDFELLVSDVVMPGMTGPQLAERMLERQPGLRVLYMSGYTSDGNGSRLPHDERASVLQKPFTPHTLLREVRQALDRVVPG